MEDLFRQLLGGSMRTVEEIITTIRTGLGEYPCDLKLADVRLVNVYSGEIYPTDIYIKGRRIVSIEPGIDLKAEKIIDCRGQYACPGLIDSHMHFETTMLSPEALSNIIVPRGTLTLCADLMEIANVAGEDGLKAMISNLENLPLRLLLEVPSRVPTAPGLETTGAVLDSEAVKQIMAWNEAISLGELDPSKILFVKEDYIRKVADTLSRRKIVNGHAIGRLGQELNVYASSGISDDHETVTAEEMMARLRVGMNVFIREGSTERNLNALVKGIIDNKLAVDNISFCTDDKHPNEIAEEGHINYNVKRSIELGLAPVDALKIATINAAKHFRLEDEFGSITPGRLADILIIPDLNEMQPSQVYFEGKLVAENGKVVEECRIPDYPAWIKDTVHLKRPISPASFEVRAKKGSEMTNVRVIEMIDRQIINNCRIMSLPVKNGLIQRDLENDVLKLSVVERYGKTGGVGIGFVKGFNLKRGALAFSTSHDHHNIVVIGVDDESMSTAVNELVRIHGGCSVAEGNKVVGSMSLVLGGLMSDKPAPIVMEEISELNRKARELGCKMDAPFMALSFISLPTVPDLGLTDMGLVDALRHCLVDLEV